MKNVLKITRSRFSRILILGAVMALGANPAMSAERSAEYAAVQNRLQSGWGIWKNDNVLGQVLLPYGLEVRFALRKESGNFKEGILAESLLNNGEAIVTPGLKTYDGSYSDLTLAWRDIKIRLECATTNGDLVMLATPLALDPKSFLPPIAVFSVNLLWNRPGTVSFENSHIAAHLPGKEILIYPAGTPAASPHVSLSGPYLPVSLAEPAAVSTGKPRSLAEIQKIVDDSRAKLTARINENGPSGEVRGAIESVMAWDTIYDPENNRIISPVSRNWSRERGGWVLFCWDTFFAATLASEGSRDLAYANVLEVLNEASQSGMILNVARAKAIRSEDRSQPPVGSITVLQLYRRFKDRWFLRDTYERLMTWNAWWPKNRAVGDYLVWGSQAPAYQSKIQSRGSGSFTAAKFESGLDNSHMYDDASLFDKTKGLYMLADVGLMSLFVADCDALAEIARILDRPADVKLLNERAAVVRRGLETLWDAEAGIYLNKNLRSGQLSRRTSPTNFYPFLAKAPTEDQARSMVQKHLLNPEKFGGPYILPSTPRDDPAFKDQTYWRGRIWGPMNYLVWLGLANYHASDLREARRVVGQSSLDIFLKEWNAQRHVHENYSAIGDDHDSVKNSDPFYHWGALMGLIGPGVDPTLEAQPVTSP